MATNFPTSLDNFTNPTANDSLNIPSHSLQHANANDAIEAIETYLLNGGQGLTHINTTTFTAQSTVSLNNIFTTAYDNYRIMFECIGSTTSQNVGARLRVAGSDSTASSYHQQIGEFVGTSASAFRESSANIWNRISTANSTSPTLANIDIANPALSRFTTVINNRQVEPTATTQIQLIGSAFANTTLFDGISFIVASGTMSGTVRVYGYRNS
jgi:hypothetical protein